MASLQEYKRRLLLPLVLLGLAGYYFLVFQPLAGKADGLDVPVQDAWKKLARSLDQTNATGIDFAHITNQLAETRQALAALEATQQKASTRLEVPAPIQARMLAPFELIEYENDRSRRLSALVNGAAAQRVSIAPAVFTGFPQHTFEVRDPALLWPALAFTDDLLATLLRCKVTAIHTLSVPLSLTNPPPVEPNRWFAVPLEIEFSGPAAAVDSVIRSLPLRAEELGAVGLPLAPDGHSPLLIERIVLRKEIPEQLDQVRAWLRVLGFVRRSGA